MSQTLIPPSLSSSTLSEKSNLLNPPSPFFSNPTFVTGGTRGIGNAIGEELVGFGPRVRTCCRNESELDGCLNESDSLGFGVTGSVCDVSVRAQREELPSTVSTLFDGKLNILINNAKRNIRIPVVDFTAAEFSTLMATNFESVFHISQLAYPKHCIHLLWIRFCFTEVYEQLINLLKLWLVSGRKTT